MSGQHAECVYGPDDKPNISCTQCGKTFQRQDVLRKHLRESCKGSHADHVAEPSRKRQRLSSASRSSLPPQASTVVTNDLSSLEATLAPAIQWDEFATPQATEPLMTLPARAESALGIRNPIVGSNNWGGNTVGGENMDDIFGWLFQHDVGVTVPNLHDSAPFSHHDGAENVSPTDLSYNIRPVAPITPIEFHPINVRNSPLQPPRIPSQSTLIPLSWTLPEPGAVVDDVTRGQMLDMYEVGTACVPC